VRATGEARHAPGEREKVEQWGEEQARRSAQERMRDENDNDFNTK